MRVNKVHCSNLRNCQQGDRQAPDLKVNKLPQVENHGFKVLNSEEVECAYVCVIVYGFTISSERNMFSCRILF